MKSSLESWSEVVIIMDSVLAGTHGGRLLRWGNQGRTAQAGSRLWSRSGSCGRWSSCWRRYSMYVGRPTEMCCPASSPSPSLSTTGLCWEAWETQVGQLVDEQTHGEEQGEHARGEPEQDQVEHGEGSYSGCLQGVEAWGRSGVKFVHFLRKGFSRVLRSLLQNPSCWGSSN